MRETWTGHASVGHTLCINRAFPTTIDAPQMRSRIRDPSVTWHARVGPMHVLFACPVRHSTEHVGMLAKWIKICASKAPKRWTVHWCIDSMHKTGNCMLDAMRKRRSIWWPSGGLCIRTAVLCIACTQAWASVLGLGTAGCSNWVFYA